MRRPLIPLTLLVALGFVASFLWNPQQAIAPRGDEMPHQALPKSYVDGVRLAYFGDDGELEEILEAPRIEQYGQRTFALLTQPRFYSRGRDENTWSASARQGSYDSRKNRLVLRDDVVLVHDQKGTRLEGSSLDIYLDTNQASSAQPVTITQGEHRTTAAGLLANLDEETLILKPHVESTYAPQL